MKLLKQDFPGLDSVFICLPHPGRLLFQYFQRFQEVKLTLGRMLDVTGNYVFLNVVRKCDGTNPFIEPRTDMPRIDLTANAIDPFYIRDSHIGHSFAALLSDHRAYLKNQLGLDKRVFALTIHRQVENELGHEFYFISYFWDRTINEHKGEYIRRSSIRVILSPRFGDPIPGLELGHFSRHSSWHELVPSGSVYARHLKTVVNWYKNWMDVRAALDKGIVVDLQGTWDTCVQEINDAIQEVQEFEKK